MEKKEQACKYFINCLENSGINRSINEDDIFNGASDDIQPYVKKIIDFLMPVPNNGEEFISKASNPLTGKDSLVVRKRIEEIETYILSNLDKI